MGSPPVCRKGVEFIRIDADPAEVHRAFNRLLGMVADPYFSLEEIISCARELSGIMATRLVRVQAAKEKLLSDGRTLGRRKSPCRLFAFVGRSRPSLTKRDPVFLLDGGNIWRRWPICSLSLTVIPPTG